MASDPLQMLVAQGGGNPYLASVQGQQGLQAGQQQIDINGLRIAAAKQEQQQAQSYQQDVESYFKDPKPERLASLIAKYPQQADALKQSKAAMDEPARQSQLTQYGQLYNAASAGRTDLLIKQATALKNAEAAQGVDTSEIDDVLGRLQSSDPTAQKDATKQILALSQVHIAALDPKFAENIQKAGQEANHFSSTGDSAIYDQRTGDVVRQAPEKPAQWEYDSKNERWIQKPGTGGGGQSSAAGGGAAPGASSGSFDPRAFFKSFTLPHEGGYAAHDANGAPVNMGVNQSANPDVDVRNITPEQAADIFVKKYANGTENMPPALGGVFADTAYINPTRAAQFLKQSGGDPAKFLAMRKAWQASLVAKDPEKYGPYQKAWANRNRDLAQYIAQQGGSAGGAGAPSGTPGIINVPSASGGAAADITPGDISTVPTPIRASVQAIAEGRSAPPRPGSRNGEALLDAVTAYDPTFDAANATSRVKTRVDFTSGKSAQAVNSLNTAMGHLLHLDDQAHDLGNFSTAPGILNPIFNTIREKVGNNTALPAFNQTKQAAASEMRKVFAGASGGSEKELEAWESQLSSSKSYEQLHDVIKNGVTLMGSRLSALQDQYATGMGRSDQIPQMIKPSIARAARQRFGVDLGAGAAQGPVKVTTPAQAAALPSGTLFQTPDGRTLRKR